MNLEITNDHIRHTEEITVEFTDQDTETTYEVVYTTYSDNENKHYIQFFQVNDDGEVVVTDPTVKGLLKEMADDYLMETQYMGYETVEVTES